MSDKIDVKPVDAGDEGEGVYRYYRVKIGDKSSVVPIIVDKEPQFFERVKTLGAEFKPVIPYDVSAQEPMTGEKVSDRVFIADDRIPLFEARTKSYGLKAEVAKQYRPYESIEVPAETEAFDALTGKKLSVTGRGISVPMLPYDRPVNGKVARRATVTGADGRAYRVAYDPSAEKAIAAAATGKGYAFTPDVVESAKPHVDRMQDATLPETTREVEARLADMEIKKVQPPLQAGRELIGNEFAAVKNAVAPAQAGAEGVVRPDMLTIEQPPSMIGGAVRRSQTNDVIYPSATHGVARATSVGVPDVVPQQAEQPIPTTAEALAGGGIPGATLDKPPVPFLDKQSLKDMAIGALNVAPATRAIMLGGQIAEGAIDAYFNAQEKAALQRVEGGYYEQEVSDPVEAEKRKVGLAQDYDTIYSMRERVANKSYPEGERSLASRIVGGLGRNLEYINAFRAASGGRPLVQLGKYLAIKTPNALAEAIDRTLPELRGVEGADGVVDWVYDDGDEGFGEALGKEYGKQLTTFLVEKFGGKAVEKIVGAGGIGRFAKMAAVRTALRSNPNATPADILRIARAGLRGMSGGALQGFLPEFFEEYLLPVVNGALGLERGQKTDLSGMLERAGEASKEFGRNAVMTAVDIAALQAFGLPFAHASGKVKAARLIRKASEMEAKKAVDAAAAEADFGAEIAERRGADEAEVAQRQEDYARTEQDQERAEEESVIDAAQRIGVGTTISSPQDAEEILAQAEKELESEDARLAKVQRDAEFAAWQTARRIDLAQASARRAESPSVRRLKEFHTSETAEDFLRAAAERNAEQKSEPQPRIVKSLEDIEQIVGKAALPAEAATPAQVTTNKESLTVQKKAEMTPEERVAAAEANMQRKRREWIDKERVTNPQFAPDIESKKELLTPEQQREVQEYENLRYKTVARQGREQGYKPFKLTKQEQSRLAELDAKYRHIFSQPAPAPKGETELTPEDDVAPNIAALAEAKAAMQKQLQDAEEDNDTERAELLDRQIFEIDEKILEEAARAKGDAAQKADAATELDIESPESANNVKDFVKRTVAGTVAKYPDLDTQDVESTVLQAMLDAKKGFDPQKGSLNKRVKFLVSTRIGGLKVAAMRAKGKVGVGEDADAEKARRGRSVSPTAFLDSPVGEDAALVDIVENESAVDPAQAAAESIDGDETQQRREALSALADRADFSKAPAERRALDAFIKSFGSGRAQGELAKDAGMNDPQFSRAIKSALSKIAAVANDEEREVLRAAISGEAGIRTAEVTNSKGQTVIVTRTYNPATDSHDYVAHVDGEQILFDKSARPALAKYADREIGHPYTRAEVESAFRKAVKGKYALKFFWTKEQFDDAVGKAKASGVVEKTGAAWSDFDAFVSGNTVHLNLAAGFNSIADILAKAVRHEAVGHAMTEEFLSEVGFWGNRKKYSAGNRVAGFLADLYESRKAEFDAARAAANGGVSVADFVAKQSNPVAATIMYGIAANYANVTDDAAWDDGDGKNTMAAEYVANIAERMKVDPGTIQRAKTFFKELLASFGVDTQITDDDLRVLVSRAQRRGGAGRGDARPSIHLAQLRELDARHAELERLARAGDKDAEAEAQRMVYAKAKMAGYTLGPAYHGSPNFTYNKAWSETVAAIHKAALPEEPALKPDASAFDKDATEYNRFWRFQRALEYNIHGAWSNRIPENLKRAYLIGQRIPFTVFDASRRGESTAAQDAKRGFFFTTEEAFARRFQNKYSVDRITGNVKHEGGPGGWYRVMLKPGNALDLTGERSAEVSKSKQSYGDIKGYDTVINKVKWHPKMGVARQRVATEIMVTDPSQIKSAAPFTYRDDGTLIPLSERFNEESDDIRESITKRGSKVATEASKILEMLESDPRYVEAVKKANEMSNWQAGVLGAASASKSPDNPRLPGMQAGGQTEQERKIEARSKRLANPMLGEKERDLHEYVLSILGMPDKESVKQWDADAEKKIASDGMENVMSAFAASKQPLRHGTDVSLWSMAMNEAASRALNLTGKDDDEAAKDFLTLVAITETGVSEKREAARVLRSAQDRVMRPADRMRRMIAYTIHQLVPQDVIDGINQADPDAYVGIIKKHKAAILRFRRMLEREGLTDIGSMTDSQLENPITQARILRALSAGAPFRDAWADMYMELYRNSLFSIQTHVRNISGNGLNYAVEQLFVQPVESAINKLTGQGSNPFGAQFSDWKYFVRGMMPEAWARAAARAYISFRDEIPITEFTPESIVNMRTHIGGNVGRLARVNQRLLLMADEFNKSFIMSSYQGAIAYRLAKHSGLVGEDVERFIKSQLETPFSESWHMALDVAKELSFQGEKSVGAKMVTSITRFKPKTQIGKLGQIAAYEIAPFINTADNIIRRVLRMTPGIGAAMMVGKAVGGKYGGMKGRALLNRNAAEQIVGAIFAYLLWGLVGDPDDPNETAIPRFTGSRLPSSQRGKSLWRQENMPAASVRIGDKWHSLDQIQPVGGVILNIVDGIVSLKRALRGKVSLPDALAEWGAKVFRNTRSNTFTQGIDDVFELGEAISRTGDGGSGPAKAAILDYMSKNLASNAGAFLGGNIMRSGVRALDDYLRDARVGENDASGDFGQKTLYRIFPSASLAPFRYNWRGEPIKKNEGLDAHPVSEFLLRILSPSFMREIEPMNRHDAAIYFFDKKNPDNQNAAYFVPLSRRVDEVVGRYKIAGKMNDEQYAEYNRIYASNLARETGGLKYRDVFNPSEDEIRRLAKAKKAARAAAEKAMAKKIAGVR